MSQLDLPQLSLQRYVDLVRRRRWQLVPVSLFGLLVGGLVAFFIPRYYLAEAQIEHRKVAGQIDPGAEDPFEPIVDNAQETIKLVAGDAMRALRWPEGLVADPSVRTLNERQVQERITVLDKNAGTRNRDYALIRVLYLDRDGPRAAALANTLASMWIDKQIAAIREPVEQSYQRALEAADRADKTYVSRARDKQALEQRYGVRPDIDLALQAATLAKEQQQHAELQQQLLTATAARDALAGTVELERNRLAALPPRVDPDPAHLAQLVQGNPMLEALVAANERLRQGLRNFTPGTWRHRQVERQIAESDALLKLMLPTGTTGPDGKVPNPAFADVQQRLELAVPGLRRLESEVEQLQTRLADEQRRLEDLRTAYPQLHALTKELEEAADAKKAANEALRTQESLRAQLTTQRPIKQIAMAQVPPHPTEPNIVVVALIGCVLGLGVAIGLILLLDLLQGTFKTVDDVERVLAVPVLGGLSHLETVEERQHVARSRRRAAAAAFGFVGLVVVVVTIFYVAPTRLPPMVRDLLTLLLGS